MDDLLLKDFPGEFNLFDYVTNDRLFSFARIKDILADEFKFENITMHKYLEYDNKNYSSDKDLVRDYVLGDSGCSLRVVYESKEDTYFHIKFIFDNLDFVTECCNAKTYSNCQWDEFKDNLRVYFSYGVPVLGLDCSYKDGFFEEACQDKIVLIHKDRCEVKSIFDDCYDDEDFMAAPDIFDIFNKHIFVTPVNAQELLKEQVEALVDTYSGIGSINMEIDMPVEITDEPYMDKADEEETGQDDGLVPDGISQIRLVSLKLDGEIVAYRFKTDKGSFDIRKSVMVKYGFGGTITDKFINLEYVNGILMSASERKNNCKVPNVSDSEKDCKKLINLLFK